MSDLVVHTLAGGWGMSSLSPFCLKLETYLRIVDLPFQKIVDATPFSGPKGKAPWIEHEGKKIGDSGFIIEYLESRFGCDPNAALSASERAVACAMRRLIEENLYWTMVYDRWMVENNWRSFRDVVLGKVPAPIRQLIAPLARRGVRRQLKGHGIGLHSQDEIHAIGRKDIGAIADFLGDKPFVMGATASEIDAIAYAFLANIMNVPIDSPVKDLALKHKNLVDFIARIQTRYFA
ncbi:MAG: glutathione S-transferase N-terminal domain-containing protein [Gammaproteobacteria bacterium]|nr:glutathione S-transferase N-terminal domain-containing protein [Gammaproteobacteria bacterium]